MFVNTFVGLIVMRWVGAGVAPLDIVGGADIARSDNAEPYHKGGHRETCFSVRVGLDAHYKFMFDAGSII